MADTDAIADLFANYAWANDTHDLDVLRTVFVADATFSLSIAGETAVGPMHSLEDLAAFFGEAWGAQTDQRRHVTSNFRYVEQDDDTAHVVAYLLLMATEDGTPRVVCTGIYDTRLARGLQGWRFTAMSIELDSGF